MNPQKQKPRLLPFIFTPEDELLMLSAMRNARDYMENVVCKAPAPIATMTEKDKRLISEARTTRSNHEFIASLIPHADTEECRSILKELESYAFRCHERIAFEHFD